MAWSVAAAVGLLVVALVYVPHIRAYFFLFDDYSLVGVSSRASLRDILTQPLFGFYRPAAFLLTRAEFQLFGGWNPAGFAASALALHVLNAALAGLLAHRLRVSTVFTLATATLFLLSPWSGEAFFWTSARFDLLAASGLFLALLLADLAADATMGRVLRGLCLAGAAGAGLLALVSKEAAVTLPLLFGAYVAMRPAVPRAAPLKVVLSIVALFALAVAGYLVTRQAVLPGLAGAYGSFGTLMAQGDLPRHLLEYATGLVLVPMPADWSFSSLVLVFAGKWPFLVVVLPAALLAVARQAGRHMIACVAGFILALVPVAWIGVMPMSTASGRLLYLPGLFFALLLARGLHEIIRTLTADHEAAARRRAVVLPIAAAVAITVIYFTGSLQHQQRMWRASSALARAAMRQFEPLVGTTQPVAIENLPFWFEEGPFVLKSYAFQFYYAPRSVPPVRATASVLAFGPEGTSTVLEVARIEEPGAPPPRPDPDERRLSFTLPVRTMPAVDVASRR